MTTTEISSADQAAVAELPRRVIAAWAEHDADAFAEIFTEDGTMILPGTFVKGRAAIRDFMAEAYAGPYRGTRVTGQPFHVTVLGTDSVVILTEGGVLEADQTEVSQDRAIRASWVAVKRAGQWKLAAYQNSPK